MKFDNLHKMNLIALLSNMIFFGAVTIPFFLQWGHLNYTQLFFLQAWFTFWMFAFDIPTGALADVIGRKLMIFLAVTLTGTAAVLYSLTANFYVFMLAEFIWGLSLAFLHGADKALIYDTMKEERTLSTSKRTFSRYLIFITIGVVIGLPVGSAIAGLNLLPFPDSLRLPVLFTSIPLFLSGAISLSLKEPKIYKIRKKPKILATMKHGFRFFFKHNTLKILALDMIPVSVTTFLMYWFYQSLLLNLKVNLQYFGFVAAGFNIFGILLIMNIQKIEKFVSKRRLLYYSALLPGLAYLFLSLQMNSLVAALIGIFVVTGFGQLRQPLFDTYMNKYIPSRERATVLSTISTFNTLGIMLAYPLIGMLSDFSLQYTFLALGIVTILFALISRVKREML